MLLMAMVCLRLKKEEWKPGPQHRFSCCNLQILWYSFSNSSPIIVLFQTCVFLSNSLSLFSQKNTHNSLLQMTLRCFFGWGICLTFKKKGGQIHPTRTSTPRLPTTSQCFRGSRKNAAELRSCGSPSMVESKMRPQKKTVRKGESWVSPRVDENGL